MNDQPDQEVLDAEHTELAIRPEPPSALAMPAVTPAQAKDAMRAYQDLCEAVLDPDEDYQSFTQRKRKQVNGRWQTVTETRKFKKKSAVKKLQTFWNIEVKVLTTTRDEMPDGHFGFRVVAVARAKNGRECDATGACATTEERFDVEPYDDETEAQFASRRKKALARAYHDVLATAETRATNRAVMNCIGVGGGEVTAEEFQKDRGRRTEEPRQVSGDDAADLFFAQHQPSPAQAARAPQMRAARAAEEDTPENRTRGIAAVHALAGELGIDINAPNSPYRKILLEDPAFAWHFEDPSVEVSSKALTYPELRRFWSAINALREA